MTVSQTADVNNRDKEENMFTVLFPKPSARCFAPSARISLFSRLSAVSVCITNYTCEQNGEREKYVHHVILESIRHMFRSFGADIIVAEDECCE